MTPVYYYLAIVNILFLNEDLIKDVLVLFQLCYFRDHLRLTQNKKEPFFPVFLGKVLTPLSHPQLSVK